MYRSPPAMISILWAVLLLSLFASAQRMGSNSTVQPSVLKLNINSSLTATSDNAWAECESQMQVYSNSVQSHLKSFKSALANGEVSTISKLSTAFKYSSSLYTLDDGHPRLSLIPTATYLVFQTKPPFSKMLLPNCSRVLQGSCGKCTIYAESVGVHYWPINTISSSDDSEHVTAVLDGLTFTSPTIYLSFDNLATFDLCYHGKYINTRIGIHPSRVSSIEIKYHLSSPYFITRSFNFEDLIGPVPARAYFGQWHCAVDPDRCLPIRQDAYRPVLAFPSEFHSLLPGWEDCFLYPRVFDPPRILQPAQALAAPTSESNADPPSSTATPQAPFRPLEPTKTENPFTASSPFAAPIAPPKKGDPPAKDANPPSPTTTLQAPFRPLEPMKTANPHVVFSPFAAPIAPPKKGDPSAKDPPSANPSVKDPAAKQSPVNTSPGPDGLTQHPSNSGGSSSGRAAATITLGSQMYSVDANSHPTMNSKTLPVDRPAAVAPGQTAGRTNGGVLVGGTMHAVSAASPAIPSSLDTAESMLYTGPDGEKVLVAMSSTLSAGGEAGQDGGTTLAAGVQEIIVGSQTINPSASGTSKPHSGGLVLGGQSLSFAGTQYLTASGELQMPEFPAASPTAIQPVLPTVVVSTQEITADPASPTAIRPVLPTVVLGGARTITVDPAGKYLVNGQTFTVPDPEAAALATIVSEIQRGASAARAPAIPTTGSPAGLGQRIFDGFNGASGEGGGKDEGGTSGSAAGNRSAGAETGAGPLPVMGRAAGKCYCSYGGWRLMLVGIAAGRAMWDGVRWT